MTVGDQARVFAAMLLCGASIGAANDLLGVLRRGRLGIAAADLLLGTAAAAGMIAVGLKMGCEVFRLYTLAGAALGWVIYACSLGTVVRVLAQRMHGIVKKSEVLDK